MHRCGLRSDEAFADPGKALAAVSRALTYSEYLRKQGKPSRGFGIFGDVCVTGYTSAHVPKRLEGRKVNYPSGGFVIPEAFREIGGVGGLVSGCRNCPANTNGGRPAGCAGTLYQHPESPETQEQLEGIISRLGLADEFADAFPQTTPIWYGLWAKSPLSARAARLLGTIIAAMHEEDAESLREGKAGIDGDHLSELLGFARATELAEQRGLPLYVSMAPPGHTDLGWYTVFPHCPFCKAAARLERWQRRYPIRLYPCHACGTEYPPAETASSELLPASGPDLRDLLGPERFPAFAKSYVVASAGLSEADAEEVVRLTETWERERRWKFAEERRKAERQDRYVKSVLFDGLHPVYHSEEGDEEDADNSGGEAGGPALFNASEFAELLRRCEDKGVKVTGMFHRSASEELDRWEFRRLDRPAEVFGRWRGQGCGEWFGAYFKVPDDLLNGLPDPG